MSVISVTNGEAVYDMLLCFVFGLGLSFFYQMLTALFPFKGRLGMLLWHVIFFAAAGLCAFCFCIGVTTCKEPRWQLLAGFVLGIAAYLYCFSHIVGGFARLLVRFVRMLLLPIVWPMKRLWDILCTVLLRLQNHVMARYNKRRQQRGQRRRAEVEYDTQECSRPPIQAAHKT